MSGALTASNGLIVERHFIGSQDYFGIIHTNGYKSHVWPEEYEAIKQLVAWEEARKPWRDALNGQLWLIRFDDFPDTDISALVKGDRFVYNDHCHEGVAPLNDPTIVAGKRIWPVVGDA